MTRRSLYANIAWLIADRGARLLIAFGVNAWIARVLGPEQYGALSYAQAAVSVIGFLNLAAIEAILVRMLVDHPEERGQILGSALLLRGGGGLLTLLVVSIAMRLVAAPHDAAVIAPLIAATTILQAFDVVEYWLRLQLKSRYGVIARITGLLLGGAARLAALLAPDPLVALAAAMVFEAALVAAGMYLASRYTGLHLRIGRIDVPRCRRILREAGPMIAAAAAVSIYVRFGYLILGNSHGTQDVGLLSVANVVAEALHAPATAVAASYGPILLALRDDPAEFGQQLRRLMRLASLASLTLAAGATLLGPILIPLIFGARYAASGPLIAILAWTVPFVYLSVVSELWFVGHGLQRYILPKTVMAAVLYVALNLIVAPHYGATGVAGVTVLTYSISAFWSNLALRATRPLFIQQLRAFALSS